MFETPTFFEREGVLNPVPPMQAVEWAQKGKKSGIAVGGKCRTCGLIHASYPLLEWESLVAKTRTDGGFRNDIMRARDVLLGKAAPALPHVARTGCGELHVVSELNREQRYLRTCSAHHGPSDRGGVMHRQLWQAEPMQVGTACSPWWR